MLRSSLFLLLISTLLLGQTPRRLAPEDGERIRNLRSESLSADGRFVAYLLSDGPRPRGETAAPGAPEGEAAPSRDSTLHLHDLHKGDRVEIAKVVQFTITDDGQFLIASLRPPEEKKEPTAIAPAKAPTSEAAKPAAESNPPEGTPPPESKPNTSPPAPPGAEPAKAEPATGAGSNPPAATAEPAPEGRPEGRGRGRRGARPRGGGPNPATAAAAPESPTRRPESRPLLLRRLADGASRTIEKVHQHWLSNDGRWLLVVLVPAEEKDQGLYALDLSLGLGAEPRLLLGGNVRPSNLVWMEDQSLALFISEDPEVKPAAAVAAPSGDTPPPANPAVPPSAVVSPGTTPTEVAKEAKPTAPTPGAPAEKTPPAPPRTVHLYTWKPGDASAARMTLSGGPTDLVVGRSNPRVTHATDRVFLILEPAPKTPTPAAAPADAAKTPAAASEKEAAAVTIWHWKEQEIPSMRRRRTGERKTSMVEVRLASGAVRNLGDERLPSFTLNRAGTYGVASDGDPYAHERTWDRGYQDHWLLDVNSGDRQVIARRSPQSPRWSRDGRYLFLQEGAKFYCIDPQTLARTSLLDQTKIDLELDPLTEEPRGGIGEVLPGGKEVLFSDGFDLWAIPLDGGVGRNLTGLGATEHLRFRHLVYDEDQPFEPEGKSALLHAVDEDTKAESYYRLDLEARRLGALLVLDKDLGNPRRAKRSERWLFTLQDSDECPDLWTAAADFSQVQRVSDTNRWLVEYEMARTELVHWSSADGIPLQGILFRPVGYEPGKRYPTIVYMYEKLSQGLHSFRGPGMNLNPQVWAQRGYAVFLPDIVYELGRPGLSAVKCVVPGVQKLVDMGLSDPKRVGLCGHSWGGYETAYIITQTTLFKAAVAGAPVVNMTSAYNGIRWESGLPRQFQYERTQSRIGGTLWDYPERFIENSPVFHLDHVQTPVLILFGNEDGAVPWYQGIEYYLAMRRLGKPAVFLEYDQEGHGLRKPANIADYTMRLHAFFDHYLKDAPAPDWLQGTDHPKPLEPSVRKSAPVTAPVADPAK